jgi:hypothetical protein
LLTDLGIREGTSEHPPSDALFVLPYRLQKTWRIKDLHDTKPETVRTIIDLKFIIIDQANFTSMCN